jgi:phosphatidylinositol alpha 1,6-mannosyltransferase
VSQTAVRVAFFTDSFHDVNGVAHTSRQLEAFARRREYPILSVHAGHPTQESIQGSVHSVELGRSRNRVPLDDGLAFDPWFLRYLGRCLTAVAKFKPNVVHITGPGDIGILGALVAWRRAIPLVASWHTNLHEYAGRRWFFDAGRDRVQDLSWTALMQFYKLAKVCLAPNEELRSMVETHTHRPTFLMERGIDTQLFAPARRTRSTGEVVLGYVGRLRPEKNVIALRQVELALKAAGVTNYRFLVVGDGSQREWLRQNLERADFTGVLKGEALAEAYANMDLFLFPSWTDTYGNVIAEALASGVPAIVTTGGGPKFLVRDGVTGLVAPSDEEFARRAADLAANRERIAPMRQSSRDWAVGRSWDSVFEKVWLCYEQASASMAPCPKPFATAF